ncbi:venom protease [Dendroctonus ponderosae]|uniref:venom protease n=1 Tax=Dendroctonus ponderosae TaxID=77166 RepID=UPI002035A0AD|nr:venom protease [Dendroctonus ponderosae]
MKTDVLLILELFIILCTLGLRAICQEVGEQCTIKSTGESGTCKVYSDCPGIEEQGRLNIAITLCGFYQLIVPVVCCKNKIDTSGPNDLTIGEIGDITFPTDDTEAPLTFRGGPRKSELKCFEYTRAVTDVVHAIPLVANIEPISINVTRCEYNSVALIVGGTPAAAGEFPFMVSLILHNRLLNRLNNLLSSIAESAHCTFTRDGQPRWVRLGALDMERDEESGRAQYDIDRIIVHPEYKFPVKYNDIALISTTTQIQFSKYIRPACLYTKSTFPQKFALATGWGQTDYSAPNSDKLLKVQLNIYDNSVCAKAYQKEINANQHISKGIVGSMLCAGELEGGRDTCLGDSGGPLFITEEENMCKFYIIGITSFGKLCAQENVPALYTRVSEYVQWIENTIW